MALIGFEALALVALVGFEALALVALVGIAALVLVALVGFEALVLKAAVPRVGGAAHEVEAAPDKDALDAADDSGDGEVSGGDNYAPLAGCEGCGLVFQIGHGFPLSATDKRHYRALSIRRTV